jgi:hypothetical protein
MAQKMTWRRGVQLVLLAWLAMIGFDLFWHAGIVADLYAQPDPFLLAPERAFALIPLGYLSFLLLAVLLVWLAARVGVNRARAGAAFGLQLGALAWGALLLGLFSIATAPPLLLAAWFAGQTVEMGLAGAVVGYGLSAPRLRGLFGRVLLLVFLLAAAAIMLQNLDFGTR